MKYSENVGSIRRSMGMHICYGGIIGHDDSCSRVPGIFVKLQEKTVELFRNNSREPRQ